MLYEDLVIEESRSGLDPVRAAQVLAEQALSRGARAFAPAESLDRFVERVRVARELAPEAGLPSVGEEDLRQALVSACGGLRSFAELCEVSLLDTLRGRLGPSLAQLERLAPERVRLPGGRAVAVNYEPGKPPWIESRLQDFFGMAAGPAVGNGRVPLVLHLLAPNQRAVQVTTDLAGFWQRHYPTIRKELCRKYPRHAWPEDPRTASPPPPHGRRG
jgi:ATP-dependent helicase HrpB